MLTDYDVEQVFLARTGGHIEVNMVLVTITGVPLRDRMVVATRDYEEAIVRLGRRLAQRPDVDSVDRARIRIRTGDRLDDAPGLKRKLVAAYSDRRP